MRRLAGADAARERFVEESAERVEELGRVSVTQLEAAFMAHSGDGAIPRRELTEAEVAAQRTVPRYRGTLAEIFSRRRSVANSDPPLGSALRFELESLVDGTATPLKSTVS